MNNVLTYRQYEYKVELNLRKGQGGSTLNEHNDSDDSIKFGNNEKL